MSKSRILLLSSSVIFWSLLLTMIHGVVTLKEENEILVEKIDALEDINDQVTNNNAQLNDDLLNLKIHLEKQQSVMDSLQSDLKTQTEINVNLQKENKELKVKLEAKAKKEKEERERAIASSQSSSKQVISRGAVSKKKEFYVESTAYVAMCDTGCTGITATGINLRDNPNAKVIAVDPSIIPLGSKVHVEGYGYAIAGDTGGAINGYKIDVHVPTVSDAMKWGRKRVKVTILK